MTDSSVAIEETEAFTEFTWHYLNRTRFKGSEGGWENHFPSGSRETEVIDILALTCKARRASNWHSQLRIIPARDVLCDLDLDSTGAYR